MTYRLSPVGVIEIATGAHIKKGEPGWAEYAAWLKAKNTPLPAIVELEPLDDIRAKVRSQINQWRNRQEQGSLIFEYDGRSWDGGLKVRDRLKPTLNQPALPAGFFWTSADDEDVPMTMAELIELDAAHEAAIVSKGWEIHARQREMKAEIEAMDRDGLTNYTIGWGE